MTKKPSDDLLLVKWGKHLCRRKSLTFLLTLLGLFLPYVVSYGANISPDNPAHYKVTWNKEKGCYAFEIRVYDYADKDNWASRFKVKVKKGTDMPILFVIDLQKQSFTNGGTVVARIRNLMPETYGKIWVNDKVNGFAKVPYSSTYYSDTEAVTAANGYGNYNIPRTNGEANHVVMYWYPNNPKYINQDLTFNLTGTVRTEGSSDSWWKDTNRGPIKSEYYNYNAKLTNGALNTENGAYEFNVAVDNVDRDKYTTSKVVLQTSTDGNQWFDRKTLNFNSNYHSAFISDAGLTKYKFDSRLLTAQEWANGVYVRAVAFTNPDGSPDGSGSSNYVQQSVSSSLYTGATTVLNSDETFKIIQNNRNVDIHWETINPTREKNSQNQANFIVERYIGNQWTQVGEVLFNKDNTKYTYTYSLKDNECNIGKYNYQFRIRRPIFNNVGIWKEFMVLNKTHSIYSDYKELKILNITQIGEASSVDVKWGYASTDNGLWDNNVKIKLYKDDVVVAEPNYNETTCKVGSLQGCTKYNFRLEVSVLGRTSTSETEEFRMPDILKREISSFEVSKGYYNNYVLLSWNIPADKSNFKYFAITRTPIEGGEPVTIEQVTHNGLTKYNYQDKSMDAGVIYRYKITGYSECEGMPTVGDAKEDEGFCQPYGSISGRIAYEGSQAVEGVTVSVSGNDENSSNKSIYFNASQNGSYGELPGDLIDFRNNQKFAVQAWLNPGTQQNEEMVVFSKDNLFSIRLVNQDAVENAIKICVSGKEVSLASKNIALASNTWTQLTCNVAIDKQQKSFYYQIYLNGKEAAAGTVTGIALDLPHYSKTDSQLKEERVFIGSYLNNASKEIISSYTGYIDEIRFWNTNLDAKMVTANYNAFITGKEKELIAYYRCDESGVQRLFDISGKGVLFNKRDGVLGMMTNHTANVPSADQLSNKTITDVDGNYLINTIPYTTDGLQYNIIPSYGTHKFNPSKRPVFVSPSSTTFNNLDYADESSFSVKGKVYYAGTLYPVEGANFYVDGVICSRNGEVIASGADGSYEISVPIGDHFIQVKKNGHVFADNGRYPADPNNIKVTTFKNDLKDVYFYDNTTVTITGRVVGGQVEASKPYGMGLSVNNIGVAQIELTAGDYLMNVVKEVENGIMVFNPNPDKKQLASASADVRSKAYIAGGSGDNKDKTKSIFITTDSLTGEFAVSLPPVAYMVKGIHVPGNKSIIFNPSNISVVDATNIQMIQTDSVTLEDNTYKEFSYCVALNPSYKSVPVFTVEDMGNTVGAFGEKILKYQDVTMSEAADVEAYVVDEETKTVNYLLNVGGDKAYPVYLQNSKYRFKFKGYEEYVNQDNPDAIRTNRVPLSGNVVTVSNALSASQKVYVEDGVNTEGTNVKRGDLVDLEENQLQLDSIGEAVYTWRAGFPNITTPYTRRINIVCEYNGGSIKWENDIQEGVVMGALPSGNNFVTSGPDKVLMVLRDPPGTSSSSFWEQGLTVTTEETDGGSVMSNNEVVTSTSFGLYGTTIVGTPGFGVINEVGQKNTIEAGLELTANYTDSKTVSTTVTTTKRISTSDGFDFVGAQGDVFIGSATNIIFGNARQVALLRSGNNYSIGTEDVISTGSEFSTSFNYTTNFIENSLIPNLYKVRDGLLQTVTQAEYDSYVNNTEEVVYLTLLNPEDPRFGTRNFDEKVWGSEANTEKSLTYGVSYKMVLPQVRDPKKAYQDMVLWYNEQIIGWENTLADNEEAKINAIENKNKWLDQNYSFDSGAMIEASTSTCESESRSRASEVETLVVLGLDTGFEINKTGVAVTSKTKTGAKYFGNSTSTTEACIMTGYTLKEEGDDDAITVDVFRAPDGFGAIFKTRGGQTSCPFEGETLSKYFKPGYILSEATMQIEIPVITVDDPNAIDVPSGKNATYTLKLENNSEIEEDVWFNLAMLDETNPNGAKITMDGAVLTSGRPILVRAGETLKKTLQLTQSRPDIMEYENIKLVLKSQCQSDPTGIHDVIADTVAISAYFVPSCSDISLHIPTRVMNTTTSDTLAIQVKGYERTFNGLQAIRIQYKGERDIDWKLAKEYVLQKENLTNGNELLPEGSSVTYQFPMSNTALYPDQKYTFRAVAVCLFASEEIPNESDYIDVIKDMAKPMVLGKPTPSNGVLTDDNEVAVVFNEIIRGSLLNKVENFSVTGRLNGYAIDHKVAAKLQGEAISTEANINLDGKDFTMDMWVKINSAGEILSHGNGVNKFVAAVDGTGNVTVKIGDHEYAAINTIPVDKWVFLSIAYKNSKPSATLTANIAYDTYKKELFESLAVAEYTGNGKMKIGHNLQGAMHDLTLWNKSRSFVEAQSEMYVAKTSSTANLIGYWKMDEGNGQVIKDVARNRRMIMVSDNSWHIEADNYALQLTGSDYTAINTSLCPVSEQEDFMLEMWFVAQASSEVATLFSVNDTVLAVRLDKGGMAELVVNGVAYATSAQSYANNVWHHLALNVHRNGNAILYIDGVAVQQISGSLMPAVATDNIIIGARRFRNKTTGKHEFADYLKGGIDEFRLWKARLSADILQDNRFVRLSGEEPGLAAYYPFEKKGLDSGNQVILTPSFADCSSANAGDATYSAGVTIVKEAPALKENITLSNVDFSFVASDSKVVININESDERIEDCTLYFTLKNIYDENNNLSLPISWSAYVNKNKLKWSEDLVELKKEVLSTQSFEVTIVNESSVNESWELSGLPAWLSADVVSGTLRPLGEKVIKFTVNDFAAIGKYEEVIYLTGNKNIKERLVVSLVVTGNRPEWHVNPNEFELSMNVTGQLKITDVLSQDEDDIVGAFIDGKCVGVASPVFYSRYEAYYVMMDIYGSSLSTGKPVEFRIWDAGTGNIYPIVETSEPISFIDNGLFGSFANPFIWNAKDMIQQNIELVEGWNWTSVHVHNSDNMSLNNMFGNIVSTSQLVKSKSAFAVSDSEKWAGALSEISVGAMYKVLSDKVSVLKPIGKNIVPAQSEISILNGWNWIGVNADYVMSANNAFASLDAENGDVIKGHKGFATYDGYEWVGTLSAITPGKGYLYMSNGVNNKTFTYPNSIRSKAKSIVSSRNIYAQMENEEFEIVPINKYPSNMTVIAQVEEDGQILTDVEVGVFCGDECRGAIKAASDGLLFLTIAGEGQGDKLSFKIKDDNSISVAEQSLVYADDAMYGTLKMPYIIKLTTTGLDKTEAGIKVYPTLVDEFTGITSASGDLLKVEVSDISGYVYYEKMYPGESTRIDMSNLTEGVYFVIATQMNGEKVITRVVKQ